jgi:Ca2+-binding EF-hand superfamily protein
MTSRSFHQFGRSGTTTHTVVRSMTTFQSTPPTFLKDNTTDYKKVSSSSSKKATTTTTPAGSKAFVDCDREAIIDLFQEYAKDGPFLSRESLAAILKAIGECSDDEIVNKLFEAADENGDGVIQLEVCLWFLFYEFSWNGNV